jgi:hypothetical protein
LIAARGVPRLRRSGARKNVSQSRAESKPRILEIGEVPFFLRAYPDSTEFYSTSPDASGVDTADHAHIVSLSTLPRLARRLADPSFELVAVQPPSHAPWHLGNVVRSLFRRSVLRGDIPLFRAAGPQMARGQVAAPMLVWDVADQPYIYQHNLYLLDRAQLYFKRELPPDHWRVFMEAVHWKVPTPRFRLMKKSVDRIAKVRPISLGLPFGRVDHPAAKPLAAAEKTTDVFFAGRVAGSSTVRTRGLEEILALKAKGIRVDVPEQTLPAEEYLARCARAWLVWSPEGLGWDCFRTYEAALCGSVAVVNRQTVERHRPMLDGVHALYYDVEPGELARVIDAALADRDRLMTMARAARAHVLAHHTPTAIARYMVETTLRAVREQRPTSGR